MKANNLALGVAITLTCASLFSVERSSLYELDKYGGWTGVQGEKTGFFHLEKIDGRDWFITPEGNVFYPVALSHPYTGETAFICCEQFGGDYEAYVEDSFEKLLDLGFNCSLSEHTSPERNLNGFVQADPILELFEERNFPYAVGIYLLKHPLEFSPGESYPDIFSEAYLSIWADTIKETCLRYKDNPLVMGYYYGYGGLNDEAGLINALLQNPESSAGRRVLLEHFVAKYGDDLARYNSIYGKDAQSEEDILALESPIFPRSMNGRHMPGGTSGLDSNLLEDFEVLVAKVAEHIYQFGYTEIRKWDPNHLIFGAYLKPHSLDARTWKSVAPYLDAISPQHVVDIPDIDDFIRISGLPVLVSDQLFGVVYPDKIRFAAVENHDWRGQLYTQIMKTVASHPGMLGVSYCNCLYDQRDRTSRLAVGEQGIFDRKGRDRPEVSGPIKMANKNVYSIVQGDSGAYRSNISELMEMWKSASDGVSKDPDRQWKPPRKRHEHSVRQR